MGVAAVPVGLAGASAGLGIIGSLMQGSSASSQYTAQSQAASYNSQVARNNAEVARMNQVMQTQQAEQEAEAIRRTGVRTMGTQRAQAAASGIDLSGSFEDVTFDSLTNMHTDILNTKYKGQIGAWNSKVDEMRYRQQAGLLDAEASNYSSMSRTSKSSGLLSAIAAGISGGSNIYDKAKSAGGYNVNPVL